MLKVNISDVGFDDVSQMGVVILIDEKTQKVLPIWIGIIETQGILMKLKNIAVERPMTHDLLKNVIDKMGGQIESILIKDLEDNIYFAEIIIKLNEKKVKIDSRPSDAIALALRSSAQIFVADKLMEKSLNKKEFEEKQKNDIFKNILEKIDSKDIPKA